MNPPRRGPLVSVITPSLNAETHIGSCIESVRSQSWENIEHLVIDGGSSDGTIEVVGTYPGVICRSEPDSGQSQALNKGFALAKGDLLTWLNADDTLLDGAVEAVVRAHMEDPSIDWFYGDCQVTGVQGDYLIKPPSLLRRDSFDKGNVLAQQGTFFTAKAFRLAGPIDEDLHLALDFDLWVKLVDAGARSLYLPRPLAKFDIHPESKTGTHHVSAFLAEEAKVLFRTGRIAQGHLALGRGAITWFERGPIDKSDLMMRADQLTERTPPADVRSAYGAALREAFLFAPNIRNLWTLLASRLWLYRPARQLMRPALRAGIRSSLKRLGLFDRG